MHLLLGYDQNLVSQNVLNYILVTHYKICKVGKLGLHYFEVIYILHLFSLRLVKLS